MNEKFVKSLIKASREFLKLARAEKQDKFIREMYIKASVAFAWFALEGFINLFSDDFLTLKNLELHEKAFLEEKKVEFNEGIFELKGSRFYPIKDKILFLLNRFGHYKIKKSSIILVKLSNLEDLRNALVHPKTTKNTIKKFQLKHAEEGLLTVSKIVKLLYKKINKKEVRI